MIEQLKRSKDVVWSGDGRFGSMGHSAKYGLAGSSQAMGVQGAKQCFDFILLAGLAISVLYPTDTKALLNGSEKIGPKPVIFMTYGMLTDRSPKNCSRLAKRRVMKK